MLALEAVGNGESHFTGFDAAHTAAADDAQNSEIARNIAFYEQADKLLLEGYTGQIDPDKKTVGVPYVLMIHKFFPMANAFFSALGFNVVRPTRQARRHSAFPSWRRRAKPATR